MYYKSIIRLFIFLIYFIAFVKTQKLFAETKFELDSNLPVEDNLDPKPIKITKKTEEIKIQTTTNIPTTTTVLTTTLASSTIKTTKQALPVALIVPSQQQNLPLPLVPQKLPQRVSPKQQKQPIQQQPLQNLPTLLSLPSISNNLNDQNITHFYQQSNILVDSNRPPKPIERAEIWFLDNFDTRGNIYFKNIIF